MTWSAIPKMEFSVKSKEDSYCPCCGSLLKKRDKRKRIHRLPGGKTEWYLINRLKCTGENCGKLHNELPECLSPYKHYDAQLIEDVLDGVVSEEDIECEDYPSEQTMKHWRYWMQLNEKHVEGQMKSTGDRLLDLGTEFAGSTDSLLKELRVRIAPGWLKLINRFLYNHGGGMIPVPC